RRHHVAVGDGDIELHVVVVVEERDPESDIGTRCGSDAAAYGDVRKQPAVEVEEETVHLGLVVGHDQTRTSTAGEICKRRPHPGPGFAVGRDRNPGQVCDLGERAIAGVV